MPFSVEVLVTHDVAVVLARLVDTAPYH
jgi:hypothetical protein